jgi:peptide/nickel transport system ATP-binding protein
MERSPHKSETLLHVSDLKVHFRLRRKHPFAAPSFVHAVDGVSFEIPKGSTFGLVGESGCGKTTTALAVMRLIPVTAGRVMMRDMDITALTGDELRRARRHIQIIFQDPYSSLNPRVRARKIVSEPLRLMKIIQPSEHDERVAELFRYVGLRPEQQYLFPHQFSGGQRQRIVIARALGSQPDLIVCDEPVSALDVAIQAQILNLLRRLQREFGLTYLFISHDMGVIQHMCDEIAVMYLGAIVEQAGWGNFFKHPMHPYTLALLSGVPSADPKVKSMAGRINLEGDPPNPLDLPEGCRFASRCPFTKEICRTEMPILKQVEENHRVACHLISDIDSARSLWK